MGLVDWLERRRYEEHLNRQEFASSLGIPKATYSKITTGRTRPSIRVLAAVLRKYPDRKQEIADVVVCDAA
jgi:transcriptional regulator with XRE-family HTH domain